MSADLYFTGILSSTSSFFFFFRQLISELAEGNSTTIGHMLGIKCNLKTHVQNLGYPLPLQIGGQKPAQLNGNKLSQTVDSKLRQQSAVEKSG